MQEVCGIEGVQYSDDGLEAIVFTAQVDDQLFARKQILQKPVDANHACFNVKAKRKES